MTEQVDAFAQAMSQVDPISGETSVDIDVFKSAFRAHPSGIAVLTADAGDGPVAMTISSLSSLSTDPPLVVFSASSHSSASSTITRAETVVVHLLTANELWLAELGTRGGVDRFADKQSWTRFSTGEPFFLSASAWLRAKIVHRVNAGNAQLCIARIVEASTKDGFDDQAGPPLVYHAKHWHCLGEHSKIPA